MRRIDVPPFRLLHTKFQEHYRCSSNIKILSQKFEGLQCWYYRRGINKLRCLAMSTEFIKIVSAIQELIRKVAETAIMVISSSYFNFFFQNKGSRMMTSTFPHAYANELAIKLNSHGNVFIENLYWYIKFSKLHSFFFPSRAFSPCHLRYFEDSTSLGNCATFSDIVR
jgi:hypothetical protein